MGREGIALGLCIYRQPGSKEAVSDQKTASRHSLYHTIRTWCSLRMSSRNAGISGDSICGKVLPVAFSSPSIMGMRFHGREKSIDTGSWPEACNGVMV